MDRIVDYVERQIKRGRTAEKFAVFAVPKRSEPPGAASGDGSRARRVRREDARIFAIINEKDPNFERQQRRAVYQNHRVGQVWGGDVDLLKIWDAVCCFDRRLAR
ncbi:hypothetical protein K2O51_23430 [Cupriavidus pinatubonensis]|uniref:hypothetical protein n=1 Tax=Cupriavidus pinatubonensis TaxID=248026 RepID=UPI001C72BA04|nr:hypothetical protein [Cupriavidus pinatubonensis]QYY30324.1 hypothetical protein K2O51_23430 [Cupriavidus pinatubonensis]